MRISWLDSDVIRIARERLMDFHPDWGAHFMPHFEPPPAPPGVDPQSWPRIAEHVARAERVSQDIRERGLDAAIERFGDSDRAIELAILNAAALQSGEVAGELLVALLRCEVDDLIVYGPFLDMLQQLDQSEREQAVGAYEQFCEACRELASEQPMWRDRVSAVRDGLASFYVSCGRHEEGHEAFAERHREDAGSLLVALTASRVFLAAGAVSRAIAWLGTGAERAEALGRGDMASRLRNKQAALRKRQN